MRAWGRVGKVCEGRKGQGATIETYEASGAGTASPNTPYRWVSASKTGLDLLMLSLVQLASQPIIQPPSQTANNPATQPNNQKACQTLIQTDRKPARLSTSKQASKYATHPIRQRPARRKPSQPKSNPMAGKALLFVWIFHLRN